MHQRRVRWLRTRTLTALITLLVLLGVGVHRL
jgi:hypothetical protein